MSSPSEGTISYQQFSTKEGQFQGVGEAKESQRRGQYIVMEDGNDGGNGQKKYKYDDEEENPGLFPGGVPDKHLNVSRYGL